MKKSLFSTLLFPGFLLFCIVGIAQAEGSKRIIVWDFDGTIVDSARECYVVSLESFKRHEKEIKEIFGSLLKEYSYEEFYGDRPYVKKAYEYFLHDFSRSFMNKRADQLSDQERKDLYIKYKSLFERLTETFYSVRKEFQNKDMGSWYELNPVYKGIPEAMQRLKDMGFEFVVMSTKDKVSIWSLFKHHGLQRYFDERMIFDNTTGRDRREQMENVQKKVGPDNEFVIIDDLPEQLAISKTIMEGKKVRYIGAKWGYGIGWDKYPFITLVEEPQDLIRTIAR